RPPSCTAPASDPYAETKPGSPPLLLIESARRAKALTADDASLEGGVGPLASSERHAVAAESRTANPASRACVRCLRMDCMGSVRGFVGLGASHYPVARKRAYTCRTIGTRWRSPAGLPGPLSVRE